MYQDLEYVLLIYDAVQFGVLTYFCEVAASPESNAGMPQFLRKVSGLCRTAQ